MSSAARMTLPRVQRLGLGQSVTRRKGSRGWNWYYRALAEREKAVELDTFPEAPEGHVRPRVYMSFKSGHEVDGRVEFELADDIMPKTAENFMKLCSPETTTSSDDTAAPSYTGSTIEKIIHKSILIGGDVNGAGGRSAFADEPRFGETGPAISHQEGVLSMACSGVDSMGSQFIVVGGADGAKHLDGYHVAFGRVVEGMDVVKAMSGLYCVREKPIADLVIDDCGVVSGGSGTEDSREAVA